MSVRLGPRVVIAGTHSGVGKTTVATGLMAAFRARGLRVASAKVGPDFIDPGYHSLATGRPGRNLDPVLVGEDRIGPLFAHGAADTDIAVIEGVLGLFDGRVGADGFGSTAHVARLLDAPVLLVVDTRGQGRSLAALLHGFRGFEPGVRLAGVLLNRVGSARHEQVLRDACAEAGLPVLGALGRADAMARTGASNRHTRTGRSRPASRRDRNCTSTAASTAVLLTAASTAVLLTAASTAVLLTSTRLLSDEAVQVSGCG